MENDIEIAVMTLITHSGDARSLAIEAIRLARSKKFIEADEKIIQCKLKINEAHQYQTKLIVAENNGNALPVSLLMIHAQDHVMNAITVKDLAIEMIETMKES